MKNMILLIGMLLTIAGCNKEEEIAQSETTIYGTWQLIEIFDGGSLEPNQKIQNGYLIGFSLNGNLVTTNQTMGCPMSYDSLKGNYLLTGVQNTNLLNMTYTCIELDDNKLEISYYFGFDNGDLLLTEVESTCDEGCYNKFRKIAEESSGD